MPTWILRSSYFKTSDDPDKLSGGLEIDGLGLCGSSNTFGQSTFFIASEGSYFEASCVASDGILVEALLLHWCGTLDILTGWHMLPQR